VTPARSTGRPRWRRRALVALPIVVLGALLAGSLAAVADLADQPAGTPTITVPRPSVPLVSLRRDLGPLADEAADRRLLDALGAFVASQPPDTCLTVQAGPVRFDHRGDDPQVPASATKVLTGVAALTALGPDFRHVTSVTSAAPPADGVVAGDLFLVGGGDPLLAVGEYAARYLRPQPFSDLRALADAVVAAGVQRVDGDVVGDESRYDTVRYHPTWPARYATQGQTGPLSALSVNDGFLEWPSSGDGPVEPAPDPAALAADLLRVLLEERGVVVAGGARSGVSPPGAPLLVEHPSLPLHETVGQLLRDSDNATAELLLKELGLQLEGAGTFDAGARAVARVLTEAGFDLDGARVVDGSGLSTSNQAHCRLLLDLLEHEPTQEAVRRGLAVAGETGTMAERWLDTPLAGRVRAKTGTLNQVTALAGFAETGAGDEATFAVVVNVDGGRTVGLELIAAQQRLAEVLVAHPDRPDLSGLSP
jgi:serine-type D-Ala-D-Ala carboxypeptidase/endopeptidase (penicillin-binding protein 4)